MSNEKPVRITVGDVKEVAEANTTNVEESVPSTPVSQMASAPYSKVEPEGTSPWIIGGAILGILLFIWAGYMAFSGRLISPVTNKESEKAASVSTTNNAPSPTTPTPAAQNAPESVAAANN